MDNEPRAHEKGDVDVLVASVSSDEGQRRVRALEMCCRAF